MTMPDQSPADVVLDDGPALNEFSQYAVSFEAWQAAQALAQRMKLLEDATPVDRQFFDAITFGEIASGFIVSNSDTDPEPENYIGLIFNQDQNGDWFCEVSDGHENTVFVEVKARGDVRRLCWGLGIELREENAT